MLRHVGLHICWKFRYRCYLENRCQSVLWQRIIRVIGESFPAGGSHFRLRVNDRGVTHAGESFTPLTPFQIAGKLRGTLTDNDSFKRVQIAYLGVI